MTQDPILVVSGLNASREGAAVTFDLSFSIGQEEVVGLLGPNGAGKSTTVDAVSGLTERGGAQILFDGNDVTRLAPHELARQGLIQVSQERDLFPLMDVGDNLLLGRLALGKREVDETRLDRVLEMFPVLKDRWRQRARSLSGGEQQMLAIGRALMSQPKLLLLDEPSTGLAPVIIEELATLIPQFADEGMALVLVEQNVKMALTICERFLIIRGGRCIFDGNTEDMGQDAHAFLANAYI